MATMQPRNARVVGAVNIGSSSVTAIIAAIVVVPVRHEDERQAKGIEKVETILPV